MQEGMVWLLQWTEVVQAVTACMREGRGMAGRGDMVVGGGGTDREEGTGRNRGER